MVNPDADGLLNEAVEFLSDLDSKFLHALDSREQVLNSAAFSLASIAQSLTDLVRLYHARPTAAEERLAAQIASPR